MDYKGYKLINKIMLVCRDVAEKDDSHSYYDKYRDSYQAYLVDPSNKKQLETARHWAKWTEYGPSFKNEETGRWDREYEITHDPVEFEFDNNGFELELLDCAGGSSQGGKLSFWNCVVTRDGNKFVIGINSDMLLELLKNAAFVNGKCQSPLIFITKSGKVGMTVEGSETWQQCIKDRELKKEMQAKAVSKFSFGDKISTATIKEIYLGTLTQYYKVETGDTRYYYNRELDPRRYTVTKLAKPIVYHLTDSDWRYGSYDLKNFAKVSEVIEYYKDSDSIYAYPDLKKKCAKRAISGKLELDVTEEDFYKALVEKTYDYESWENYCKQSYHHRHDDAHILCYFLSRNFFGFNTEPFELDEKLMQKIKDLGIRYIDETKPT